MKINNFDDFLNEEFFKKVFNSSKKKTNKKLNRVDSCIENMLNFLSENGVYSWDDFLNMPAFDRDVINKLIDSEVKTMDEVKEVRFRIKLELCDRKQLLELKDECESNEEYEKCARIVKRLSQK